MITRVNAVDLIYATSPVYLYLNPEIIGYLLRPLLEYQESPLYPNSYAAQDIGRVFYYLNVVLSDQMVSRLKLFEGHRKQQSPRRGYRT